MGFEDPEDFEGDFEQAFVLKGRRKGSTSMRVRYGKALLLSCFAWALIASWGCAGPGKPLEPPRAQLAGIRVSSLKMFEAAFQVDVRLFNTNDVALEIKAVDCELELNGKPFAAGVSKNSVTLPAYGTETISVLLYSSVVDVLKGLAGLGGEERLRYRIAGRIHLGGGFLLPSTVPFSAEGEWHPEGLKTP